MLFAAEKHPELIEMIQRKFKGEGDVARATELVFDSKGIERTRQMAEDHCRLAADTVSGTSSVMSHRTCSCILCSSEIQLLVLTACIAADYKIL